MSWSKKPDASAVFLNVPYSISYEKIFVAIVASLVALGRKPHTVVEISDKGQGRLKRIFKLMRECGASIHDISATGLPARFNMPFELGMAYAIKQINLRHNFFVFEKKPYRIDMTLSDLKGIDPKIHHGTVQGAICAVLEAMGKPARDPTVKEIYQLYRKLWKLTPGLKKRNAKKIIFGRIIFQQLVDSAVTIAKTNGLIKE